MISTNTVTKVPPINLKLHAQAAKTVHAELLTIVSADHISEQVGQNLYEILRINDHSLSAFGNASNLEDCWRELGSFAL